MGAGLYGSSATLLPVVTSMPTRLSNSLAYATPQFANLSGGLSNRPARWKRPPHRWNN